AFLDTRDTTLPDFRVGEDGTAWAALLVVNATAEPLEHLSLRAATADGDPLPAEPVPPLPPCGVRKVGFRVRVVAPKEGDSTPVRVELMDDKKTLDTAKINV